MHKDAGEAGEVKSAEGEFLLCVDGGATVNNLLMQIQVKKIFSFQHVLQKKNKESSRWFYMSFYYHTSIYTYMFCLVWMSEILNQSK